MQRHGWLAALRLSPLLATVTADLGHHSALTLNRCTVEMPVRSNCESS
jgi:hypothetical protein